MPWQASVLVPWPRSDSALGRTLGAAAAATVAVDDLELALKLTIGIVVASDDGATRADAVAAADAATYAAKEAGGGQLGVVGLPEAPLDRSPVAALARLVRVVGATTATPRPTPTW